ncbi:lactosylceramide 4-alpha-galactosyltransferase-like isoform X1 [Cynara cardunculus var. scolymus]|uniref:Alpha 1,4-glycosyltransferase domain-containing protein n=1 Tax=Cynara cardunculus var. scolymus TaxID=59895 RepID=A0A103XF61_CYNCS|nr:lactosylceramide 4-alpha-galactosyltransferase-like isoform X1 [Cynara cardunculus var. scolymus]KVH89558.1 Alpha 1,4-glycosyltransferase domain-containing protein [Cynara cardunculus var. scolymus]
MENKNINDKKRSFFAVLSVFLLLLISFNGASIFSIKIPYQENVTGDSGNLLSMSSSLSNLMYAVEEEIPSEISRTHLGKTVSGAGDSMSLNSVLHSMHDVQQEQQQKEQRISLVKEETPPVISNSHLPLLRKSHSLRLESEDFPSKKKRILELLTSMESSGGLRQGDFRARVKEFFSKNETSCKVRFFMTWISSLDSFSDKEFHSIETLFNTHPKGCLLIVSNSMDSSKGNQILRPFLDKGFRVTAISPDLNYLLKNTEAESWFSRIIKGDIDAGYVPFGQNLSNLLRLCLLYKYGGVYIDTDLIIMKSFSKLKNSIGAQTLDLGSKNWSRLNNAVMVFDKMHPLVYKFIEEFSLTFNGNKWGHNGPYLVSRVVSRLQGRPGYNFTILPPPAFYPVNWNRVRNLFRGPKNETDAKWLRGKLRQIRSQSYAVHLWNKQSRKLHIKEGSILRKILSDHCVFCNSSTNAAL